MKTLSASVMACVMALAACGKGGGAKGSGAISQDELGLFRELPGNNVALFGGNYMKMQNFMSSTIGKSLTASMKDEKSEAWMTCFTSFKDMKIVGGIASAGKDVTMRIVFSGLKPQDIADCAKKGDFKTTLDADGKFVSVDVAAAGMTVNQGYLSLPSGKMYSRTTISLGGLPSFSSGSRADLEADIQQSTKVTAADDTKVVGLLAKVDRSKTFWFAGTAKDTPLADKLGEVYGSVDLDGGMAIDVTVQLNDGKMVDKIEEGVKEAKKMSDKMPGDLKGVIDGLEFSRDGDHVRFADKLTEAQLTNLMSLGGMGMGGMGRKRHSME
jgi:hypothetical protein